MNFRKFAITIGFSLGAFGLAWAANTKLSSLSAVSSVGGTDLFYDVQTPGSGGLKATAAQIFTYMFTGTTGALKSNGSGTVTQAACADLSNGATGCSTATGTSGGTMPLLNGTNTWSGVQTFGEILGTVTTQSGATYTIASTDCGTEVTFSNASAVTVTIPQTLPAGCNIAILQLGAGKVSVNGSAVTPATLHSAHSYTGTSAQYAIIGINIEAAGTPAIAILTGDGA